MNDIYADIASLKARENATILAHYYQDGDIQELADFTGDSLKLARAATTVRTGTIVFCGVHFMAETAKMLNPDKRVLLPDLQAGCSLADSCPAPKLARYQEMLRENGRRFQTVTYINSTAAVKALSDWVVTSGNAEEIIRRVPAEFEILFVPDRHLGQYLEEVTGRKMILWNGACMVHEIFSVGDLLALKKKLPGALTVAHPECPANIREHSDFVGGTEAMLRYLASFPEPKDFLVATEPNMLWQFQGKYPRHRYHPVPGITCACNKCPHMARNTLEKLRDCLQSGRPEITWQPEFARAREVLQRSLLAVPLWRFWMPLIPHRFLFRMAYPCPHVKELLDLPETCRLDNFAAMDGARNFADVRLGWNELGLGLRVEVRGKTQVPMGDASRPRGSDGITLWIDTRDARTSHRASRYCHQFHLLPAGGGPERDEPVFLQTKINRALQDAPLCLPSAVPFRCTHRAGGYVAEAFLPAAVLNGFDPEQNPRLGFYYAVRDAELDEQVLSVGADFPYWEDPSLWSVLELVP